MTNQTQSPQAGADLPSAGDLHQLAELATLVNAARDAISDDIVSRAASAFSEGITLLDRLTRNEGLVHLLGELDHAENQQFLICLSNAFTQASRDLATVAPSPGGIGGLLRLMSDPGVQEGLRLVSLVAAHLSDGMREMHRRGN
ncbi:DUF1641 domain-containing protein [Thiocapsa roseopersicina]|jgi:hypothetical protein|uniref:DUF1641 domain-containing protein n=1 Tax=Thiocapsa roseopersicina TaxID=1058 RepID=A0A1H3DE93_THIRO|nr:DUF1641 domain-containing protein [Thiocapsa roseopersicina]SDX64458.1 hypothetical protein SAMN05421783_1472 [Thiocapsa roseopersicina]